MLFIIIFSLCTNSLAQLSDIGGCAFTKPMEDFKIKNFAGKWYEIERTANPSQFAEMCTSFNYTFNQNYTTLLIQGHTVNFLTGAMQHWEGTGFVDTDNPAKMEIKFPSVADVKTVNDIVIDTDYSNYAVTVECPSNGQLTHKNAWLLSRTRHLDKKYILHGRKVLRENGVSKYRLLSINQQNCPQ